MATLVGKEYLVMAARQERPGRENWVRVGIEALKASSLRGACDGILRAFNSIFPAAMCFPQR